MKVSLSFKIGKRRFTFNNESKMLQYYLMDFNDLMPIAWFHIMNIYDTILRDDDKWHFFYENEYSIIRCQSKFQKKIEKYFKDNDIEFNCKGEWTDDHPMVTKYQEHYTRMFHDFTMLAMKLEEDEITQVADRIIHPFFNHCTYMAEETREKLGDHLWEGILMAQMTACRSAHAGRIISDTEWRARMDRIRKEQEAEKEKDNESEDLGESLEATEENEDSV